MTGDDALALALLASSRRPFLGALVRTLLGRPVEADASVPPPDPGEPVVAWAARCLGAPDPAGTARRYTEEARRVRACAERAGLTMLALGDREYPDRLAEIPDPPPVLWCRGAAAALSAPAVAIVGARAATAYGVDMARALASGLADRGVIVVSGLARGIDAAAHTAALDAGGATVAVLGSGVDRVYPAEHATLAARAVEHGGAVLSELPPGAPPLAYHFPLRNRLISGLSAAVVVVEAAEKSGSLITAACALDQGRDVMAVPGPVRAGRYRGCHALLKDGARLVETADDILAELGWGRPPTSDTRWPGLDPDVASTFGLPPETIDFTLDDVVERTGMSPGAILSRLLAFEMDGRIHRIGSGRYSGARANVTRSET